MASQHPERQTHRYSMSDILLIISKIHESCSNTILGGTMLAFYILKLNQPVRFLLSKETMSFGISPN
jgi:hypothetical protein